MQRHGRRLEQVALAAVLAVAALLLTVAGSVTVLLGRTAATSGAIVKTRGGAGLAPGGVRIGGEHTGAALLRPGDTAVRVRGVAAGVRTGTARSAVVPVGGAGAATSVAWAAVPAIAMLGCCLVSRAWLRRPRRAGHGVPSGRAPPIAG